MDGITSYKHLNEIILTILRNSDREMTACEINDIILNNYKVSKVRINPLKIAKRLRGVDTVDAQYGKKGLFLYKYNQHI